MIDTNKLRQLAQGVNEHSDDRAEILAEFYAATQSDTIIEILDRLEAAEKSDAESLMMYRKARGERDALRAENDELRKALAQKVTSETMLRDLSVGNGSINATFEGGAAHLLVDSLATQFIESGVHNYIEMQFHSEATGPLLLTLQRVNGATPHELLAKVEKERDILCDRLVLESQKNSALHEAVSRACEERDALPAAQALLRVPDAVITALDNLDDYMSRIEGNDRGACNHINLLRRYLLDATVGENK